MPRPALRQTRRPRTRGKQPEETARSAPDGGAAIWTRAQAARALGVSVSGVRRLEAAGTLRPTVDAAGVRRFDPAAVRAAAAGRARQGRRRERQTQAAETDVGRAAARLWLDGAPLAQAVVELGCSVERAASWWRAFNAAPGRRAPPELAELAAALGSSSLDVGELVRCAEALRRLARQRPAGTQAAQAIGH